MSIPMIGLNKSIINSFIIQQRFVEHFLRARPWSKQATQGTKWSQQQDAAQRDKYETNTRILTSPV